MKTAAHEIEVTFESRLEKIAEEGLHKFEEAIKDVGAEVAIKLTGEILGIFVDMLHDAIPDKPQGFRIGPFEFVWRSLDARLDKVIDFVEDPPHGVDGLVHFAQDRAA